MSSRLSFPKPPLMIMDGGVDTGCQQQDYSPTSSLTRGGDVMKFIVEVDFPLEPFSTYVRKGTAGEKIGEVLGAVKPEVIYFTDNGVGRGAVMIVEVDSASQVPHVTEPLMLNFDASVHYRVAMAPEELQSAGLERYATG
jgi:hypothetical protein